MASSNFSEGQSISRPALFSGSNYAYWKTKMTIFLQSLDCEIWETVELGYVAPTKVAGGKTIPKPRADWDQADKRATQMNAKAMNALICALSSEEYNRVVQCRTAQQI
eukprot:TRINITY_DN10253_c0_g1_i1.p1 TRINITY_DN10253_c0_g1~~TRINITY_DN10253_c0_g1_i1.p1  ORF type:complete len:108 (-),score=16.53 TRINITY_DN10253_c0_g1_i1:61-384(-)